jgi:NADH dehydrogenase [ubiquinone] 1 alpha subcomplex assembly factor 7
MAVAAGEGRMNALAEILAARIKADGPMTLADYMGACLLHPDHGYYATRDPFGQAGDFTTAPEISQMFGELLGLCLAQTWMDQGRPPRIVLAEIGPGRGTLMADMLRAIGKVPGLRDAACIHLIEASDTLRQIQARTLQGQGAIWHSDIATLPEAPLYLVANEFFDALPIRQFQRADAGWSERQVGLRADMLGFGLTPPAPYPPLTARLADTTPGDIVELCPALPAIAQNIGMRIARHGGAALIVDYGNWHSLGDTYQAVQAHRPVDPFAAPGAADQTAHVDFEALALALTTTGAKATSMTPQGVFLQRLGIAARTQTLAQKLSGEALASHEAAYRRLTDPSEMGQLFKVIACHPAHLPPPPGLDPC